MINSRRSCLRLQVSMRTLQPVIHASPMFCSEFENESHIFLICGRAMHGKFKNAGRELWESLWSFATKWKPDSLKFSDRPRLALQLQPRTNALFLTSSSEKWKWRSEDLFKPGRPTNCFDEERTWCEQDQYWPESCIVGKQSKFKWKFYSWGFAFPESKVSSSGSSTPGALSFRKASGSSTQRASPL